MAIFMFPVYCQWSNDSEMAQRKHRIFNLGPFSAYSRGPVKRRWLISIPCWFPMRIRQHG